MLAFPIIINLGIYRGACPCACCHCPVGNTSIPERRARFGHGAIDASLFDRFCDDLAPLSATVRLHAVGEPTLHSEFDRLLEIIRSRSLNDRFWLFTCGLVPPRLIPAMAESLGIIEISLNAVTKEDYLHTKGIDRFAQILYNMDALREYAIRRRLKLRLLVSRVASDPHDDEAFLSHWRSLGFESLVRSYHSYSGILQAHSADQAVQENTPKCLVAWRRLNLDGTLNGHQLTAVNCFNVLFQHPSEIPAAAVLGAYPAESLTALWNNEPFDRLRRRLCAGATTNTCCDRCSDCMTSDGERSEGIVSGVNILR